MKKTIDFSGHMRAGIGVPLAWCAVFFHSWWVFVIAMMVFTSRWTYKK